MTMYRIVNNWGNKYRIQRYSRHWLFWKKWKFVGKKRSVCTAQAVHKVWVPFESCSKEAAQIEMVKQEYEEFRKRNIKIYGWKVV